MGAYGTSEALMSSNGAECAPHVLKLNGYMITTYIAPEGDSIDARPLSSNPSDFASKSPNVDAITYFGQGLRRVIGEYEDIFNIFGSLEAMRQRGLHLLEKYYPNIALAAY